MQKTAGSLVSTITASPYNKDITTFVSYASPTGEAKLAYKKNKVDSITCTIAECTTFGATRIVIANDVGKSFFTCGMAILADLLTCPPTYDQCLHSIIATTSIASSMTITPLSTVSSTTFIFGDNLSTYCGTSNVCSFTQTFTLSCIDCYTCSSGLSTCGGTCSAAAAPLFAYTTVPVSGGY